MEIVDAYTHCGLSKYEPIENVRRVMAAAGVSRAVLVQHLGEFDNSYIESAVESDPEHLAGVLLIDHRDPQAIETLERWHTTGHFQGIRLTTDAISEAPPVFVAAGDLGLAIVLYAPEGVRPHFARLQAELRSAPFTRLVITHLGSPKVDGSVVDESARDIFELAQFANVYLQLSGMKMFSPPPHAALHPFIAESIDKFGPARIMWGSNFPVVGTQDDYLTDLNLLLEGALPVPREAIPRIAGENAKRFWFPRVA